MGSAGGVQASVKTPDLAIEFQNAAGEFEPKFIFEVGITEPYEDLIRHAKLWLEGKAEVCACPGAHVSGRGADHIVRIYSLYPEKMRRLSIRYAFTN